MPRRKSLGYVHGTASAETPEILLKFCILCLLSVLPPFVQLPVRASIIAITSIIASIISLENQLKSPLNVQ